MEGVLNFFYTLYIIFHRVDKKFFLRENYHWKRRLVKGAKGKRYDTKWGTVKILGMRWDFNEKEVYECEIDDV